MLRKLSIFLSLMILMAALLAIQAAAAPSEQPVVDDVAIENELTGTPDTVTVVNVNATDIIRVYSAISGGVPIGVTQATGPSAMVYVNQLGKGTGIVYVTITSTSLTESGRTAVPFIAEPKTVVVPGEILIHNSVGGSLDTVTVQHLVNGDIVRIYPNSVSTVTLGTAVSPGDDATVTAYVNQLGIAKGTVYVTVQSTDALESDRVPIEYETETSGGFVYVDKIEEVIKVQNRHYEESGGVQVDGTEDLVTVLDVAEGEIITIYKSSIGPEKWLPPLIVTAGDLDVDGNVTLPIPQLGEKAGKIYVTITRVGKAESKRAIVQYVAEDITATPVLADVTVTNEYNKADTVLIDNIAEGDTVKIYTTPVSLATIGSGTVGTGGSSVLISINANVLSATGGKIYITVTSPHKNESARLTMPYNSEDTNKALSAGKVTVTNNYGSSDSVVVSDLAPDDIINVYATLTGDTLIGTATAAVDTATIMLDAGILLKKSGNIYVTITTAVANESPRATVRYDAEPVTPALTKTEVAAITVTNNYSASDTVVVPGLQSGDTVRVFSASTGDNQIGIGVESGGSATASINAGVLSATGGTIYVSVTATNKNENPRVAVKYYNEEITGQPTNISVTNNYNTTDEIVVSEVPANAIVYIYAAAKGSTLLGSGPEDEGAFTLVLPDKKLSATGGKIYVSVKIPLANESPRTIFTYESERSIAPAADTVDVINNYYRTDAGGVQVLGTEDSVTVSELKANDIVRIYKASGGTTMLCAPIPVNDPGSVTIPISQLGSKPGKIYVTITQLKKTESVRVGVAFDSEPVTAVPAVNDVVIENNYAAEDIVTVKNLTSGQIVTIYTSATGTTILDTATAVDSEKIFTLDVGALAAVGGKLYITVKDEVKLESLRTAQVYTSETTATPKASNILVVNYPGAAFDTVTITGLIPGDTVRIYSLAIGGTLLSTATVTEKGATFTLDTNLNDIAGTIFVTVTSDNKAESKRVMIKYDAA